MSYYHQFLDVLSSLYRHSEVIVILWAQARLTIRRSNLEGLQLLEMQEDMRKNFSSMACWNTCARVNVNRQGLGSRPRRGKWRRVSPQRRKHMKQYSGKRENRATNPPYLIAQGSDKLEHWRRTWTKLGSTKNSRLTRAWLDADDDWAQFWSRLYPSLWSSLAKLLKISSRDSLHTYLDHTNSWNRASSICGLKIWKFVRNWSTRPIFRT